MSLAADLISRPPGPAPARRGAPPGAAGPRTSRAKRAYLDVLRLDSACLEALLELARLAQRAAAIARPHAPPTAGDLLPPARGGRRVNLGQPDARVRRVRSGEGAADRSRRASPRPGAGAPGPRPRADRARRSAGSGGALERRFRPRLPRAGSRSAARAPASRLLLLVSAKGGNIPTRALIDDTVFAVAALYADFYGPGPAAAAPRPWCSTPSATPTSAPRRWPRRARSPPARWRGAERPARRRPPPPAPPTPRRLRGIPGLVVPEIRPITRAKLLADGDLAFPRLVRFARLPHRPALRARRAPRRPGRRHRDPARRRSPRHRAPRRRGPDGLARKYRVMLIGRRDLSAAPGALTGVGRCTTSPPT